MASSTQDTTTSSYNNNNNNTIRGGDGGGGGMDRPDLNYKADQELFEKFLREHQIVTFRNGVDDANDDYDDDDDDDDALEIPTNILTTDRSSSSSNHRIFRKLCYQNHFQRIKDRHFYNNDSSGSSTAASRTFIIEVPLDELTKWDNIKGNELANKAKDNTMRYHAIFCKAIDTILDTFEYNNNGVSTGNLSGGVRDTVDVLHQQRLAVMEQNRAANNNNNNSNNSNNNADGNNNNTNNNNAVNPYAGTGNIDNDRNANSNNNNNNNVIGATEDFPPELMRRYELRILPFGRKGSLPPFVHQYHSKITSTTRIGAGMKQQEDNSNNEKPPTGLSLRQVRASSIGKLVTITGMIVRSSDVKPSCQVATYSCDACGAEVYQVLSTYHREFMPCKTCPSVTCQQQRGGNKNTTLFLQTRGSKLIKFQELKLQELPNQVPMGHVPRSLTILCRGELTRQAIAGDIITVDGVFLPQRLAESGFKAMKAGLISTTYLEAQNIVVHKKSYDESMIDTLTETECQQLDSAITQVATGPDPVGRLSASIAPEIFGHEDIKRSLLLQLVSGCTRTLPDGMRIRGDINICLMGDPGVAKSQLLKHVASIAPRGVYTTGKGSSGVGLTAAVTKDTTTGDMTLEGGALVLADRGICCIDEFDKMEEADRTAIHEVMEQQTVSIAKAGIIATLNARSSVLAAANPLYGRYNRHKSLSENINLPNSLLSRFDLLFLILDTADVDKDMALARHVTFVHQNEGVVSTTAKTTTTPDDDDNEEDENVDDHDHDTYTNTTNNGNRNNTTTLNHNDNNKPLSAQVLREYIARARKFQPIMPPEVAPYVVEAYVSLRMQQKENNRGGRRRGNYNNNTSVSNDQTVMTPRQLLSILRLSQALARLRFSDFVAREDVDEAIRLTHMSKASLFDEDHHTGDRDRSGTNNYNSNNNNNKRQRTEDVMSRIFHIIRDYSTTCGSQEIELKLCEAMVLRKGFTQQQLNDCLKEYEELQVIQINRTRTHIYFIEGF